MKVQVNFPPAQKMLVWRIDEGSKQGEWVDPAIVPPASPMTKAPGAPPESWASSSFDLLNGCDVREIPETVPDDLLDRLFPQDEPAPKSTGK